MDRRSTQFADKLESSIVALGCIQGVHSKLLSAVRNAVQSAVQWCSVQSREKGAEYRAAKRVVY